jgi:chromosome segregation ATPase
MREAVVVAFVLAVAFGGSVGAAWRPWLSEYDNMLDDLTFAQMDVETLRKENAALKRLAGLKTTERDRAVNDSEDWRKWYEQAHQDRTELAAKLSAAKSEIASLSLIRSMQAQELADMKAAAQPKLVKAAMAPLPKKKPKLKKRKPVRIVYRWVFH